MRTLSDFFIVFFIVFCLLLLGGLPFEVDEATIRNFFKECGEIAEIRFGEDKTTGDFKGCVCVCVCVCVYIYIYTQRERERERERAREREKERSALAKTKSLAPSKVAA